MAGDISQKLAIVRHFGAHGGGCGALQVEVRRGVAADGDERMLRQRAQLLSVKPPGRSVRGMSMPAWAIASRTSASTSKLVWIAAAIAV